MPQLGRIRKVFQNAQGQPIVGLEVTVRKQGATVNGLHAGAQTTFTVNDPGGITSSPQDQLQVGTDDTVTRAVSSVAATQIVVGASFTDVADDARLTPTTNLPTVYNDAQGGETVTQPMQTDANGEINCWAPVVPYDLYTPGNANFAARIIQDVVPEGMEQVVSNIYPSATSVAFQKDTSRAMVSGSKLERWLSGGVEKFYIDLSASLDPRLPAHQVAGLLRINSGGLVITDGGAIVTAGGLLLAIDDLTLGAAASRIIPGATSLSLRNHANGADNLILTDAGAATVRAGLTATTGNIQASAGNSLARRFVAAGVATPHVAGDWALSGGWGTTASITGLLANDLRGFLEITSGGTGQGANPVATLTFKDGTFGGVAPQFVVCRGADVADQPTVLVFSANASATQWSFVFRGTPVAGERYQFHFVALG